MNEDYINGYLERNSDGRYKGTLKIDGVSLSPIEGLYFKEDGKMFLWLKRSPMLEYDDMTKSYQKREREPRWQAYLEKNEEGGSVAFSGKFIFLRFCYSIVGVIDKTFGKERNRLNFFVERMPSDKQVVLNSIVERKTNNKDEK
jgi:hypothetical protein